MAPSHPYRFEKDGVTVEFCLAGYDCRDGAYARLWAKAMRCIPPLQAALERFIDLYAYRFRKPVRSFWSARGLRSAGSSGRIRITFWRPGDASKLPKAVRTDIGYFTQHHLLCKAMAYSSADCTGGDVYLSTEQLDLTSEGLKHAVVHELAHLVQRPSLSQMREVVSDAISRHIAGTLSRVPKKEGTRVAKCKQEFYVTCCYVLSDIIVEKMCAALLEGDWVASNVHNIRSLEKWSEDVTNHLPELLASLAIWHQLSKAGKLYGADAELFEQVKVCMSPYVSVDAFLEVVDLLEDKCGKLTLAKAMAKMLSACPIQNFAEYKLALAKR